MRESEMLDLSVGEIMTRWPATISVFVARRMYCVGCPIGQFHTLIDAADEHAVPLDLLLEEIVAAASRAPQRRSG